MIYAKFIRMSRVKTLRNTKIIPSKYIWSIYQALNAWKQNRNTSPSELSWCIFTYLYNYYLIIENLAHCALSNNNNRYLAVHIKLLTCLHLSYLHLSLVPCNCLFLCLFYEFDSVISWYFPYCFIQVAKIWITRENLKLSYQPHYILFE